MKRTVGGSMLDNYMLWGFGALLMLFSYLLWGIVQVQDHYYFPTTGYKFTSPAKVQQ